MIFAVLPNSVHWYGMTVELVKLIGNGKTGLAE
jgi:hypothetical protein